MVGTSLGAALGLALLSHPATARALTFVTELTERTVFWPQALLDSSTQAEPAISLQRLAGPVSSFRPVAGRP